MNIKEILDIELEVYDDEEYSLTIDEIIDKLTLGEYWYSYGCLTKLTKEQLKLLKEHIITRFDNVIESYIID